MFFFNLSIKHLYTIAAAFFLMAAVSVVDGASRRYNSDEDSQTFWREIRDSLEDIKHEVNNHETELQMFKEKLSNQDSTVEALRQEMTDATAAQKDLLKGNSSSVEGKMNSLEQTNKSLVADLKVLKNHINESKILLDQYGQKIGKLEKALESQNQNIANLESALRSMTEALQLNSGSSANPEKLSSKTYRIKSGDSLGKIAIENKTTIKALKELNPQLNNDKIIIGQTIQLP